MTLANLIRDVFVLDAEIYGRVLVDPVQNLGSSFDTNIEKVFVCAGKDGYVPKYNPENLEYGCLADTPNLRERFKILVSNLFFFVTCQRHDLAVERAGDRS